MREVHALKRIPAHKNVIEYYRAWQEQGHLLIQMELCECSLSEVLYGLSGGDCKQFDK
ncbi:hypothetical protein BVRB_025820, partial [Beta vulgaris subsp. vulgaris]